jgi:transcription elongation factor GreA
MSSSTLDPVRAPRRTALSVAQAKAKLEAVPVTADGMARLQGELDQLTRVRRPEVIERIARARELGDLKENADYTAAREEQSFLEGRVQAIEAQLRVAVVAMDAAGSTRVVLGSRVTAEVDGGPVTFEVVGQNESNPGAGRISSASPVGRALLGRTVGDEAVVATPRGEARYRIVSIE